MKKFKFSVLILGITWLSACSSENSRVNNESGSSGNGATNDSSTTNPVNSEYGTPNASENPVDSAQSVEQQNNPQ